LVVWKGAHVVVGLYCPISKVVLHTVVVVIHDETKDHAQQKGTAFETPRTLNNFDFCPNCLTTYNTGIVVNGLTW
jgi:hypothetical protein